MNITPVLPFLNIHITFNNERIGVHSYKHSRMYLDTKAYCVKGRGYSCLSVMSNLYLDRKCIACKIECPLCKDIRKRYNVHEIFKYTKTYLVFDFRQ